ncbi:MAG TPA: hypothetical protein PL033_20135 [Candidatus Brocadiia bacterium]|nr:hypothetical protein [Candidatus Brocadiia bacterium]
MFMPRPEGTFIAAALFITAALLVLPISADVSTRQKDGAQGKCLLVENSFYRAVVFPGQGGRIGSLFHKKAEIEFCTWEDDPEGARGGLLDDAASAALPYEVSLEEPGPERVQLVLTRKDGPLSIVKTLAFNDSAVISVSYRYSMAAGSGARGVNPTLRNWLSPRAGSGDAILYSNPGFIIRPGPPSKPPSGNGRSSFAACCIPSDYAGLCIGWLDDGLEDMRWTAGSHGGPLAVARMRPITPGETIETRGFISVNSGMVGAAWASEGFVGNAQAALENHRLIIQTYVYACSSGGSATVNIRLMDEDGVIVREFKPTVISGLAAGEMSISELMEDIPAPAERLCAIQEVYDGPAKIAQVFIPLSDSFPSRTLDSIRWPPAGCRVEQSHAPQPAARVEPGELRITELLSGALPARLKIPLAAGETETVVFLIETGEECKIEWSPLRDRTGTAVVDARITGLAGNLRSNSIPAEIKSGSRIKVGPAGGFAFALRLDATGLPQEPVSTSVTFSTKQSWRSLELTVRTHAFVLPSHRPFLFETFSPIRSSADESVLKADISVLRSFGSACLTLPESAMAESDDRASRLRAQVEDAAAAGFDSFALTARMAPTDAGALKRLADDLARAGVPPGNCNLSIAGNSSPSPDGKLSETCRKAHKAGWSPRVPARGLLRPDGQIGMLNPMISSWDIAGEYKPGHIGPLIKKGRIDAGDLVFHVWQESPGGPDWTIERGRPLALAIDGFAGIRLRDDEFNAIAGTLLGEVIRDGIEDAAIYRVAIRSLRETVPAPEVSRRATDADAESILESPALAGLREWKDRTLEVLSRRDSPDAREALKWGNLALVENGVSRVGFLYVLGESELGSDFHKAVWERCNGEYFVTSDPKKAEGAGGIAVLLKVLRRTGGADVPREAKTEAARLPKGGYMFLTSDPSAKIGKHRIWIIGADSKGCRKGIKVFAQMLRREYELPASAAECR